MGSHRAHSTTALAVGKHPVGPPIPYEMTTFQFNALKEFSKIPVLSQLTDQEVFDFVRLCKVHRLAAGDSLFKQGDEGRSMYIIESGQIDVYLERSAGRELVAEFSELDVIGELSLLEPGLRSATAEARSETVLYEVLGDDFNVMLSQMHPAAYKIVRAVSRIVCRRIRSVNTRIDAELSGGPAPPPHTGKFDRMSARQAAIAVSGRAAEDKRRPSAGPGKPGIKKSGGITVSTAMIRRVVSKIWGSDE